MNCEILYNMIQLYERVVQQTPSYCNITENKEAYFLVRIGGDLSQIGTSFSYVKPKHSSKPNIKLSRKENIQVIRRMTHITNWTESNRSRSLDSAEITT